MDFMFGTYKKAVDFLLFYFTFWHLQFVSQRGVCVRKKNFEKIIDFFASIKNRIFIKWIIVVNELICKGCDRVIHLEISK